MSKHYYRSGPAIRDNNQPVSFVDVRRRFDFSSIRIGRWVSAEEQHRAAGYFYDALCDLMTVLSVPETVISLRGTLSLEYGIGGQKGVAAHYIPAQRVFALAKNAGPGSIAHEWFHAFDHYIAAHAFQHLPAGQFASSAWLKDARMVDHPLNQRLFAVFRTILLDETGNNPSEFMRCALRLDEQQGSLYFSRPEEVCARAFEAFVEDSPQINKFLVAGTRNSKLAAAGGYPRDALREQINTAFLHYFNALGWVLNSRSVVES